MTPPTPEQIAENVRRVRQHRPLSPETLAGLLTQRRVVIEAAPRQVLEDRLLTYREEKAWRCLRAGTEEGWPRSVSDSWCQQAIDHLEAALATPAPPATPTGIDLLERARRDGITDDWWREVMALLPPGPP